MTKTDSREENIDFWRNWIIFTFETKNGIFGGKWQKMTKFGISGKIFDVIYIFWQTAKYFGA